MDPQIQAAILTVILAALAAIAGYFFREFRNRAKPFMAIKEIQGDYRSSQSKVDIPESTKNAIDLTFYVRELNASDTLDEVHKSWDSADDIVSFGSVFMEHIDAILKAADENNKLSLSNSLQLSFKYPLFNNWIIVLLRDDWIKPPNVNESLPIEIETYESSEYGGCICFGLKGAITFGLGFSEHAILKDKCKPFIALVERLDVEGLKKIYLDIKRNLEHEILVAKDVVNDLLNILNENSSWEIQVYIANLGKTPFLIDTKALLFVDDPSGAKYSEECKMVLHVDEGDDEIVKVTAKSPLVLGSEDDVLFSFFTKKTQSKMDRGEAFREVFESGLARCYLELKIEKTGFIRQKKLKLHKAPFREVTS